MSKFFRSLNKAKKAVEVPPREMKEIQTEYGQLVNQAGQTQYQSYVLDQELKRLNNELVRVNQEAAARQELDRKVTLEEATVQEAKNA